MAFINSTIPNQIVASGNFQFFLNLPRTVVCIFGTITNSLCIAVFLSPKMKDISFKYMLAQSVSDFIYLFSLSFQLIEFSTENSITTSLLFQIYSVVIDAVFTSFLGIFYVFVEVLISIQRYFIMKNKTFLSRVSHNKVIAFLAALSIVYYIPCMFLYQIETINLFNNSTSKYETTYSYSKTSFFNSSPGKIIVSFLEFFRIFLNSVFLSVVNILTMIEFKKRSNSGIRRRAITYSVTGMTCNII